jgi:hypothetical protein
MQSVTSTSLSGGRTIRSGILHGAAALATFALVLTSAPDAGAATVLTTGLAQASIDQVPICFVANIDKKPITVTAQLIDAESGMPQPGVTNLCPVPPATLAAGTACTVTFQAAGPSVTRSYCVVTTSSAKVRAALELVSATTGALEVYIPATK